MDRETLKATLEGYSWTMLRSKAAKDYGIRVLPEYTAPDIIRLILDKESEPTKYVTDKEQISSKPSKHGWSNITVMPGRRENDTHCRACHNGYQFAIPFEVAVNIPTVTAEYLTTKRVPVPFRNDLGQTETKYEPRWIVQFNEKNYGPEGEKDFIPPEARHKYWNDAREAKLRIKRAFYDKYGYWPTDKTLKEVKATNTFTINDSV